MIKRYDDPAALPRRQILHFIFHSLSTIKCRDKTWPTFDEPSFSNAQILGSIVVSIPACHAGDRGSIPRRGGWVETFFSWTAFVLFDFILNTEVEGAFDKCHCKKQDDEESKSLLVCYFTKVFHVMAAAKSPNATELCVIWQ